MRVNNSSIQLGLMSHANESSGIGSEAQAVKVNVSSVMTFKVAYSTTIATDGT